MNIRPKNMILYADTGVKFSLNNLGGANWRQQVFNNYRLHLLDLLAKYGEADDYGYWLNEMLSRHSNLYNLAGGEKGNWENIAYKNNLVGQYLQDYRGGLGNDGLYQRYGTIQISPDDRYDFNQTGIRTNQDTRYNIANPPRRVSGDYSREGYNYKVDNLYSAITDDRRLLGRKGDWDENSDEFKLWQSDLNKSGWETYLDTKDNYYKLRRLAPKFDNQNGVSPTNPGTQVPVGHLDRYGFDWGKLKQGALKLFSNPDLWATARLAGNLINNERVYGEALKGIKPVLRLSYHTHRQVVGDEATKQAYYRRAAQGLTKAARPFTSDADRQMAYQFEAKRVGDELRAQGDLADNQEIRRTSDESNLHQWTNTLRDTEVANANLASINLANSLRHNLLALKHSAQWSSIDNYLLGIEYRKRLKNAELQALDDLIFTLLQLLELANDPRIIEALKAYQTTLDKHKLSSGGYDMTNDEVIEAKRKYQNLLTQIAIEQYLKRKLYYLNRGNIFSAKSGTKITRKRKDDLLYKSTKDVVEHFRKMSKMSSDALNRKTPKIEKLASHPKGKTKKYLLGGVAPFTVYKPVALGGETTTSTQTGTSNTKSSSEKEGQDLLKELFKALQVEGLPSDVNGIFQAMNNLMSKRAAFGQELSTEDIASMYLLSMQQINNIKFSKALFDAASKSANDKDAILEYAVDSYGRLAVLDKDGKISFMKWNDVKDNLDKYNPLTNNDLLNLRAYSPDLAFNSRILEVVNNGIGISKIAEFLKELLPKLGSSEQTIEGYTKLDSNMIKAGLLLLKDAPAGDYKMTLYSKDLLKQALMALSYLASILPNNMKSVLLVHASMLGISTKDMLLTLIGSQMSEESRIELDAVTGRAAKDANGNSKSGNGTDTPASVLFLLGNGYSEMIDFNIGNSLSIKVLGRFGILQDKEKNNLGQGSNLLDVSKSLFGPILDLDKATFGGSRLNSNGYSHIILNNSDCIGVDLPVKKDISGNYVPNFLQLSLIEKAEEQIQNNKITDPQQINKIYRDLGLPDKFDSNGNIIPQNYRRFAGIQVILDSKALKGGTPVNVNEISEANDEERELFIEQMQKSGNKDYDLSDGILWSSWGRDKLYKGTIFVPVREDIVAGYTSGGYPLDTNIPNNANLVAMMLYAPKIQQYLKTPPLSSLK